MSTKPNPETQPILKEQRLREIIALLKNQGPLETKAITLALPNISRMSCSSKLDDYTLLTNHKIL